MEERDQHRTYGTGTNVPPELKRKLDRALKASMRRPKLYRPQQPAKPMPLKPLALAIKKAIFIASGGLILNP